MIQLTRETANEIALVLSVHEREIALAEGMTGVQYSEYHVAVKRVLDAVLLLLSQDDDNVSWFWFDGEWRRAEKTETGDDDE